MRLLYTLIFISLSFPALSQEFDSDLYAVLNRSSLSIFMKSSYTSMTVSTLRASNKNGLVEENSTTYRKGKINTDRINFTTTYTEFFILEDRKKSIGRYELNPDNEIVRYERTDFNSRNLRVFTYYHSFRYNSYINDKEIIRTKEYIGTGSAELDTVVTVDSVVYKLTVEDNKIVQQDLSEGGSTTTYTLDGGKLIKKVVALSGFSEEDTYLYDAKGQLASIETALVGEDGQRLTNQTKIYYSLEGMITEVQFYDQSGELLEKKQFEYK